MDKFQLCGKKIGYENIVLITDTIEGEGQPSLIKEEHIIYRLFVIDSLTLKFPSKFGNLVRNLVKLLFIPVQVYLLRRILKRLTYKVVHATPMYYMLLCKLAKIKYVGTPQAAEVLERCDSFVYAKLAGIALKGASHILVDSKAMQKRLQQQFGLKSTLQKNGFDTQMAMSACQGKQHRRDIVSIRAIQKYYRIDQLIDQLSYLKSRPRLTFIYPAFDKPFLELVKKNANKSDKFLGKLPKHKFYKELSEALLALSIPENDSSPRSVYEAIFCGTAVAMTYAPFYAELPNCMKKRIFLVDIHDEDWLSKAINFAIETTAESYSPSVEAIEYCDQDRLADKLFETIYKV